MSISCVLPIYLIASGLGSHRPALMGSATLGHCNPEQQHLPYFPYNLSHFHCPSPGYPLSMGLSKYSCRAVTAFKPKSRLQAPSFRQLCHVILIFVSYNKHCPTSLSKINKPKAQYAPITSSTWLDHSFVHLSSPKTQMQKGWRQELCGIGGITAPKAQRESDKPPQRVR